jgi:peroxiredoxin
MTSIPDFIVLKDYVPYKSPEPLPVDTIAPEWKLISLTDDSISLSSLKGSVVVVDFFYKSCYPCMQALPALQNLHERYADQGLKMIGIDPYDTKEDDKIDEFLAKRGVTYTVLLGGKDVAKAYRVSGYPTMYVIGKDGKIVFNQIGYGEGTEAELEEVIKANL